MFGLITEKEIQVVLDASGFAYSDQWGCIPVRKMADYSEKCRKSGKKIVLMPQAFGPFNPGSSDYIKKIINNSDLVFARDKFSLKTLLDIVNDSEKIKQSPDFTILLKGVKPDYFNPEENDICIIPNQRMMDMTLNGNEYLEIMHKSIKYLCEKGLKPFFLIMGGKEDLILADKINQVMDIHIPVINEKNPFYVKGIIENSAGVFGSRFHGLACALYSGVVAIGIGWSQKYKYLFEDVGYPEGLLSLNIPEDELYRVLDTVADPEKRKVKSKQLVLKAVEIKSKAQEMFSRVRETIGNYQ